MIARTIFCPVSPLRSPTNETVATAESDVLLAEEQTPCPTDAHTHSWTDGGDRAENRSDEPDEVAQEESGVPPEVDPIGSSTNETVLLPKAMCC